MNRSKKKEDYELQSSIEKGVRKGLDKEDKYVKPMPLPLKPGEGPKKRVPKKNRKKSKPTPIIPVGYK